MSETRDAIGRQSCNRLYLFYFGRLRIVHRYTVSFTPSLTPRTRIAHQILPTFLYSVASMFVSRITQRPRSGAACVTVDVSRVCSRSVPDNLLDSTPVCPESLHARGVSFLSKEFSRSRHRVPNIGPGKRAGFSFSLSTPDRSTLNTRGLPEWSSIGYDT